MPISDAERWNARYSQDERYSKYDLPRPFLVEHADYLPETGLALDVAMGKGGNASFLLERGLRVIGVDISWVALRHAKVLNPELMAVLADLTRFSLPTHKFDAILNFYYLQRDLWSQYRRALRPGGLLFFETLTQEMQQVDPGIDSIYLLEAGELREAFHDWRIHVYQEGWVGQETKHPRAVASLVASKPV